MYYVSSKKREHFDMDTMYFANSVIPTEKVLRAPDEARRTSIVTTAAPINSNDKSTTVKLAANVPAPISYFP